MRFRGRRVWYTPSPVVGVARIFQAQPSELVGLRSRKRARLDYPISLLYPSFVLTRKRHGHGGTWGVGKWRHSRSHTRGDSACPCMRTLLSD